MSHGEESTLADFGNAVREFLGLESLYHCGDGRAARTNGERFDVATAPWPRAGQDVTGRTVRRGES